MLLPCHPHCPLHFIPLLTTIVTFFMKVSWPKEGYRMSQMLLGCGVNDLGGTLMNESISTAAGKLSIDNTILVLSSTTVNNLHICTIENHQSVVSYIDIS